MVEIEKKYRLTFVQFTSIRRKLATSKAILSGKEFEENTLYGGGTLDPGRKALRLRRIGKKGILTYKERYPGKSDIKRQREEETAVEDPVKVDRILKLLGFTPVLIYEKRRETWQIGNAELVLDELPFGLFMEIEGSEKAIRTIEDRLQLTGLPVEHATYPQLTLRHGKKKGKTVQARFRKKRRST